MEIKKAIVVLNAELQHTKHHIQYENKAKEYYEEMQDIIDATEMAISALEKQEPKKAVGTHYAHMRCPTCNHRIPSGGGSSSHRRDNWCNYCGQKIDWSK